METRARYALIGLFILAVIGAIFGFVYWLENKGGFGERETYRVQFESSVSGLLVGSAVLFNGIRVGDVTGIALNPAAPQQVIATIDVVKHTPIREDTRVNVEQQGLTGGVAITLTGGTSDAPIPANGGVATLIAPPGVGQDWTQSARDAFQQVETILNENAQPLNEAIENIEVFTDALARNADRVDGILAGIERMTGGGKGTAPLYSLKPAADLPPPEKAPDWQLIIPEPTTLLAFNTDKILTQPAPDESLPLENARWSDSLPILVQAKLLETFENAGYAQRVSRTIGDFASNYQLSIDIREFNVSTEGAPEAQIVILAKLLSPESEIIASRKFETSAPVQGSDVRDFVDGLSAAFDKVEREILDWTTTEIETAPVSVTVEPPAPLDDMPPAPDDAPADGELPPAP
ncbi:MAG: ABC-type transport auxiliary lipoprotein family protein [Methyloceanibacter sp.]|uniref:ABC-type transport auxiliary lipoprotein family protein n=1 Tax=Methyloceanibacter sp. TaxID=1965321 RepID=UPI003EE1B395